MVEFRSEGSSVYVEHDELVAPLLEYIKKENIKFSASSVGNQTVIDIHSHPAWNAILEYIEGLENGHHTLH